jgi:hypothetical protein
MGKLTRSQHLREKMRADAKQPKQTRIDDIPKLPKKASAKPVGEGQKKQITITEVVAVTREDELALRIGFKLFPSRAAFSKVTSVLYFNGKKMGFTCLAIIQGPLATDVSEFTSVLDMKGISSGSHTIRVEMYELWSSGEKLTSASKEVTIEYIPVRREDRLIEVPIIKSVAGTGLAIVSDHEKNIYREIEKEMKRDSFSRRDSW